MEVVVHPHGAFCFPELNTADMEGAKKFYGGLLGWTAFDVPSAAGTYSLLQVDGKDVAGLHRTAQGPPHWLSYVSVTSADQTAARAQELGGTIRAAPFDVPGVGRMSMLADPAGGVVALWEAKGHPGARLVDQPGAMLWNELVVHDIAVAREFYTRLFGWSAVDTHVPNGPYTIFKLGERSVAGVMVIGADWGPVAPHWQVYFGVADCDASIAKAKTLGASVVFGPQDVPNVGRFVILMDAARAVFAVMGPVPSSKNRA
jgi:predicted enzyme related to lactoylglutathione lyase